MTSCRIVTINTGKCDGAYYRRMRVLIEQLAAIEPDVIALQESFRSDDVCGDTAGVLASALRMHAFYTPARRKERKFGEVMAMSESGMALLSRVPWSRTESVVLPMDPRDGERIAQVARLDLDGALVTFANLHLTHLREADDLRARQLGALLAHPLIESAQGPVIALGDFNTAADGPVLSPLIGGDTRFSVRDTWNLGGGSGERGTLVNPAAQGRCVDYILSIARDEAAHPRFSSSKMVLQEPDCDGNYPSDHFGVATTLELSPAEAE